ncbi:hypothetical protein LCGC14_0362040 [marine sediment metagenome]|uniref:Coil containing protein n=1 Tax=marine sediment metagenome TaxID=412755 RepID=A0A0F9VUR7_9ZZZZ
MDKNENDLNNDQVVTDQDLNKTDAVNQSGLQDQSATDQNQDVETLADGTKKDKSVKYSEFEKANKRAKDAEEAQMTAERSLELYQANVAGQQTATQQQAQPTGTVYEQAMAQLGLTEDDLYGGNIVKVNNLVAQMNTAISQQQTTFNANQQFVNSHSDFSQVVGSVNPATGAVITPSVEVAALLQTNPYLANASYQVIYNEVIKARKFAEFEKTVAANKEHLDRQNIDTASDPMGGSAAGGGAGGDVQSQRMMTREESLKIRAQLANGELVT